MNAVHTSIFRVKKLLLDLMAGHQFRISTTGFKKFGLWTVVARVSLSWRLGLLLGFTRNSHTMFGFKLICPSLKLTSKYTVWFQTNMNINDCQLIYFKDEDN